MSDFLKRSVLSSTFGARKLIFNQTKNKGAGSGATNSSHKENTFHIELDEPDQKVNIYIRGPMHKIRARALAPAAMMAGGLRRLCLCRSPV